MAEKKNFCEINLFDFTSYLAWTFLIFWPNVKLEMEGNSFLILLVLWDTFYCSFYVLEFFLYENKFHIPQGNYIPTRMDHYMNHATVLDKL